MPPAHTPRPLLALLALTLIAAPVAADPPPLERLFPSRGGAFGSGATSYRFSGDSRWACWLHRSYRARRHGRDLFVAPVAGGPTVRVTSPQLLSAFQSQARLVAYDWRKRNRQAAGRKRLSEAEQEMAPLDDLDQRDRPRYDGVRLARWSPRGAELALIAGDDLFRWSPGGALLRIARDKPRRLWWLPDGLGLLYQVEDGGLRTVRWDADGELSHERIKLELGEQGLEALNPSPDGRWLLLRVHAGEGRDAGASTFPLLDHRRHRPRLVEHRRHVAGDAKPKRKLKLLLLRLADGELFPIHEQAYTGVYDRIHHPSWRADGKALAFSRFVQGQGSRGEVGVHVVSLPAGDGKPVPRQVLAYPVVKCSPYTHDLVEARWAGQRLVMIDERDGWRQLVAFDPANAERRALTPAGGEAYLAAVRGESVFVVSTHADPAARQLCRVPLAEGGLVPITPPDAVYDGPEISPDGRWALAQRRKFGRLPELVLIDVAQGAARELTDSHAPGARAIVDNAPRRVQFKGRDGHRLPGLLFTPPGWNRRDKRPTVIVCYGGPLGASKLVEQGRYDPFAYLMLRYLADHHGWLGCAVDVRGTSGYGAAFALADYGQPGIPQVADLEDVARGLRRYGADRDRIALFGWSKGGTCVVNALLRSDRFVGAVAGAPVADWRLYHVEYVRAAVAKDDPETLADLDLTRAAKRIETPLLLIHGARDRVVLHAQSVRLYRALLRAGSPHVELLSDPSGGHRLGGDLSLAHAIARSQRFLARTFEREPAEKE